jgi:hypothetical protein
MENKINPEHYKKYDIEVIDMMEKIWGKEEVAIFAKLNAFKYTTRIGFKGDADTDIQKRDYYLKLYNELGR